MRTQKNRKRMLLLLVLSLLVCAILMAACNSKREEMAKATDRIYENTPTEVEFTTSGNKNILEIGEEISTSYEFDRPEKINTNSSSINYLSSDPSVATVDALGNIQAVMPGKTVVTISISQEYYVPYSYSLENEAGCGGELTQDTASVTRNYSDTIDITVIETAIETVTEMEETLVVAQPADKPTYVKGEALDFTGMVLLYTDEEGKETKIPFADFETHGIAANPAQGFALNTEGEVEITFTYAASELDVTTAVLVVAEEKSDPPTLKVSLNSVGETSAGFSLSASEHCTISMVIMPAGTATPSPQNFSSLAENAVYQKVYSNSQSINADVSGLAPGTAYVAFFRPTNARGIWAENVSRVKFITTHQTVAPDKSNTSHETAPPQESVPPQESGPPDSSSEPPPAPQGPAWLGGMPVAADDSSPGFISLKFGTDVDSTVYCLILPANDTAPGIGDIISVGESWACQAGVIETSALAYTPDTSYDVYFVAVSSANVAQQAYTKCTVTTGT